MAPSCKKDKVQRAPESHEESLTRLHFPQWVTHKDLIDRIKRVQIKRHMVFESGPKSAQKIVHKLGITTTLRQELEEFHSCQADRVEGIIIAHWRANNLIENICSSEENEGMAASNAKEDDLSDEDLGGVHLNIIETGDKTSIEIESKRDSAGSRKDSTLDLAQGNQDESSPSKTNIEDPEISIADLQGLEADLDHLASTLKLELLIYENLHKQMKEFALLGHLPEEEAQKWTRETGIGQMLITLYQELQMNENEAKSFINATIHEEIHSVNQKNTSEVMTKEAKYVSVKETKRELRFEEAIELWIVGSEKRARRSHRYWTKNKVDGPRRIWGKNHNVLGTTTIRSFAPLDAPFAPISEVE